MRIIYSIVCIAALFKSKTSVMPEVDIANIKSVKNLIDKKYQENKEKELNFSDPKYATHPFKFIDFKHHEPYEARQHVDLESAWVKRAIGKELLESKYKNGTDLKSSRRHFVCALKKPADEWMHCQDLITPFLTGIRTNISVTKHIKIDSKGREVLKLMTLIKFQKPTNELDAQELQSHLVRIAGTSIRLYQWSVNAIRLLLDAITKRRDHTFTALKAGVKRLLTTWHMDYSNTALLLNHTTLFKPMCVTYVHYTDSTSSLGDKKFPKPETEKVPIKCDNNVCMGDPDTNKKKYAKRKRHH